MFAPMNPEGERIRAQNVLRSFTEHENAVALFVLLSPRSETAKPTVKVTRNNSRFIMQVFKAIKPKSRILLAGLTESRARREIC